MTSDSEAMAVSFGPHPQLSVQDKSFWKPLEKNRDNTRLSGRTRNSITFIEKS